MTTVMTSPSGTRRCVMPRYQPDSAFPCLRPGAPHTARSREVAAYFERDRADLPTVLGCDICADGRHSSAVGGPILLHHWSVASRYGPPEILCALTEGSGDDSS